MSYENTISSWNAFQYPQLSSNQELIHLRKIWFNWRINDVFSGVSILKIAVGLKFTFKVGAENPINNVLAQWC